MATSNSPTVHVTDASFAGEIEQGPETNDLGADNAVEQDTIETVQPGNPPA